MNPICGRPESSRSLPPAPARTGPVTAGAKRFQARLQDAIGIQQQNVGRIQRANALIDGRREASIVFVGDEADAAAGHGGARFIMRGVVDHDHAGGGRQRGIQTRPDMLRRSCK